MGCCADVDRALADAIELRLLAGNTPGPDERMAAAREARQWLIDIGPSVSKLHAAKALGLTVTALDRWVLCGAVKTHQRPGGQTEIDTLTVVDLAVEIERLRRSGRKRGLLAEALARRERALSSRRIGTRGFFPDQHAERRGDLASTTAGERVAEAIRLSRIATAIAVTGARASAVVRDG